MARYYSTIAVAILLTLPPGTALGTSTSIPFIHADAVHAQGITGRGVTVAVIDPYGVDYGIVGLSSIADGGTSFVGRDQVDDGGICIPAPPYMHGTKVALVIAGPTGVAPGAKILPLRIGGAGVTVWWALARAFDHVIEQRNADPTIRVINARRSGNVTSLDRVVYGGRTAELSLRTLLYTFSFFTLSAAPIAPGTPD